MARQTKDEKQKNEIGFLSRWSARKAQVSKAEIKPYDEPTDALESSNELGSGQDQTLTEQDEALTDKELLEKYELTDPEQVNDEADLDRFLHGDLPARIRQMALRRLWHLNPLFGEICEMVEYGEDYTDAATVIEGMQTAYQVGKGYETKAKETEVSDVAEGDVAEGDVAEGDVAEGDVAEGDVAEGDVAEGDVAEGDVAEGDVAEGDIKQKELANTMINFMEDGAVFKDNALGPSGIDAGDYILPGNDVVLPLTAESDKDEFIALDPSEPSKENVSTSQVLFTENVPSGIASHRSEIDNVAKESKPGLKPPKPRMRPSRMSFLKLKNNT